MNGIEETIEGVERLYRTVTGKALPADVGEPYAPIPAERNPEEYVARQIDRLSAMLARGPTAPSAESPRIPSISVWETDSDILVRVELPGVARERLHVQAIGRTVHVHAERAQPSEPDARLTFADGTFGPFQRVIGFPPNARVEELSAKVADGILELRAPKSGSSRGPAREVPVL